MLQFLLSVGNVAHQRVLLFLQLRTLFAYDITQQLSLKTLTHTHTTNTIAAKCLNTSTIQKLMTDAYQTHEAPWYNPK